MTVKRTTITKAVMYVATLLQLMACAADELDRQQAYQQVIDSDAGPWLLSVALGGNPSAAATNGSEYVIVGGATRGNSYTPAGGTLTHGWQNVGLLHERNNSRVGLFTLAKDGNQVTDPSWEKFNVSTDATNGAEAFDATAYPAWTHLNTTGYGTNQLFYPEAKAELVDVYAYVPYVSQDVMKSDAQLGAATDFENIESQVIKYTLKTDQTAENDYIDSDILWGKNTENVSAQQFVRLRHSATLIGPQGAFIRRNTTDMQPDVALTMHHKTAKIVFRLTAVGMQQEKLQNAVVNINVPYITGQLNIKTGAFTTEGTAGQHAVTMTSHLGIEAQGATPTVQGSVTDGTPAKTYYCCSALIVPQVVSKAYHFTDITLYAKATAQTTDTPTDDNWSTLNPPTANYSWSPSKEFTFESGKQYIFDITVTPQQLTVSTPYVLPWSEAGNFSNPNVDAKLKAPLQAGVLLFNDGSWGSLTDNTSGQVKTADQAIGYVFRVGTTAADQTLGYKNGYAMALRDATTTGTYDAKWPANTEMAWADSYEYASGSNVISTVVTGHNTGTFKTGNTAYDTRTGGTYDGPAMANMLRNDLDGLTYCRTAKQTVGDGNKSHLIAIMAAENYKNYPKAVPLKKTVQLTDPDTGMPLYESDGVTPKTEEREWASEWYLPSVGQWMAIMESTGVRLRSSMEQATQSGWASETPTGFSFYRWQVAGDASNCIAKINQVMQSNGLSEGTHYDRLRCGPVDSWCARFWTSSEVWGKCAWAIYFNGNAGSYDNILKNTSRPGSGSFDNKRCYYQVRPVIAF